MRMLAHEPGLNRDSQSYTDKATLLCLIKLDDEKKDPLIPNFYMPDIVEQKLGLRFLGWISNAWQWLFLSFALYFTMSLTSFHPVSKWICIQSKKVSKDDCLQWVSYRWIPWWNEKICSAIFNGFPGLFELMRNVLSLVRWVLTLSQMNSNPPSICFPEYTVTANKPFSMDQPWNTTKS